MSRVTAFGMHGRHPTRHSSSCLELSTPSPAPAPLGHFIPKFPLQSQLLCLLMPRTAARHGWEFVHVENLQFIDSALILLQQGITQAIPTKHGKKCWWNT